MEISYEKENTEWKEYLEKLQRTNEIPSFFEDSEIESYYYFSQGDSSSFFYVTFKKQGVLYECVATNVSMDWQGYKEEDGYILFIEQAAYNKVFNGFGMKERIFRTENRQ